MVGDPEISADDLHALVLHELAHLRRYDDWVNLGQKILKALLFFHPAAWWLDRRITAEREMACDDAVLRSSADPHVYARCLVRLAERSYLRRTLELAQAAVGHLRLTTTRVKRLIGGRAQHAKAWRTATVLAAFGSLTSIAALCPTPQLVTFTGPQARVEASAKPTPNQSSVILAASRVERSPGFIPAKLPLSPKLPLNVAAKVRNSQSRPTATSRALRAAATTHDSVATSYWVVIETSQQFVGPEMMQVETWQVVMLSSPPTPRHPIPHKEI
jgi:hypothetical protein